MNYYDILNVSKNASQKEIKNSYKKLVKKYHPDVYTGDKTFADKKIKEINSAYDVLSNEELKKEYDESINPTSYDNYTNYYNDYKSRYTNSNSNTSTSSYDDIYEKYKSVYNNYENKTTGAKDASYYTNARENYSNYYKASAYKAPFSSTSYVNKTENYIYKKISNFSKLQLLLIFGGIYILALVLIVTDFINIRKPVTKRQNNYSNTSIYSSSSTNNTEDKYYHNGYYDDEDNDSDEEPNEANNYGDLEENTSSNKKYKDSYVLGEYEYSLDELREVYSESYFSYFSSFSDFMQFIEYAEEFL